MRRQNAVPADQSGLAQPFDWKATRTQSWSSNAQGTAYPIIGTDSPLIRDFGRIPEFTVGIMRQLPAFCVPPNQDLLDYWTRVEDRLNKIRTCRDITGVQRQLALFAPEIDPRLLVRAAAAGLSLADILSASGGDLPPYRFSYLIEKAKQYAGTVQSFGAQLLGAIEKRDAEQLNLLRTVHEQNLLKMASKMRQDEIDIANDQIEAVTRQQAEAQFRRDHYATLITTGLTEWETTQQVTRHMVSAHQVGAALLDTVAGIMYLVPQIGAPTAMKYGGTELGHSATSWSGVLRDAAQGAEAISASAGLEAGFQRRSEDWQYQVDLADHELKRLDRELAIATIRADIAARSLEVHTKTIAQAEELHEFYGSRFTNLGLYNWLSTKLQQAYREAYNAAYAMAKLAEQAFRFERNDDATPALQSDYWDATKAGLLAGDRLLLDLQALERRFIETNYRTLEITQAFSLMQIDPAALITLREKGDCTFTIPELFFDLTYPGQYRRRIKSVRLTIPCVTGPYANVGATLSLTSSGLRSTPTATLIPVPLRRSVTIATSTAQNDAGVFEFSFRDERYMPFEGAGAISTWHLALPASFRQFDYETISDVILHISYTADEDGTLRDRVEQGTKDAEAQILPVLKSSPRARTFSIRQDFSGALHRLIQSPVGTPVTVTIDERYLPFFLRGRSLTVTSAQLVLRTPAGQTVDHRITNSSGVVTEFTPFTIKLDDVEQTGFLSEPHLGSLWAKNVTTGFTAHPLVGDHTFVVTGAGELAPDPLNPSAVGPALAGAKLLDVVLYVEYQME
jgi:hypothetical protein